MYSKVEWTRQKNILTKGLILVATSTANRLGFFYTMKRDSVIFYRSFYEALKELDFETQAKVYNAILEYSLNFKEIELTGVSKTIFTLIKPQLDANNKRYENGKKGGKPKQEESEIKPKTNQKKTKPKPNKNYNVNYNENNNLNEKENYNALFFPEGFKEIWIDYMEFRKSNKVKKYSKPEYEQKGIDKLVRLSNGNKHTAREILDQSIENNWTGLFELKKQNQNHAPISKNLSASNDDGQPELKSVI